MISPEIKKRLEITAEKESKRMIDEFLSRSEKGWDYIMSYDERKELFSFFKDEFKITFKEYLTEKREELKKLFELEMSKYTGRRRKLIEEVVHSLIWEVLNEYLKKLKEEYKAEVRRTVEEKLKELI